MSGRNADDQCHDAQSLNQAVLETVEALVVALDPEGRIVLFNPACEKLTGYRGDEVAGRIFWDFLLTPDEAARSEQVFADLRPDRFPNGHVNHWIAKDGSRRLIEWSNTCLTDGDGAITLVVGTGIDVTRRTEQEAALRKSERRLTLALEQAKIGYWRWSIGDEGMHYVSDQYTDILGLKRDQVPTRQAEFNEFLHPADRARVEDFFESIERDPRDYQIEYRIVRSDGEMRYLVEIGELVRDGSGRPAGHTGFLQDVTALKRHEAMTTRLGRIVEDSANEIYVFDSETLRFLQVNHGARDNLGYSMDELRDLTPVDLKPDISRAQFDEIIAPLLDGTSDKALFETVHRRKDGSTYDVEVRLQLSRRESPPVFFAVIQDITERKLAEQALIAAKQDADLANRAKSEFLANMSHELRTPLNAIIGFAEIIEQQIVGPIDNEAYVEHAHEIREAGQHLLRLISDILDLSRIEAGKLELSEDNVDLREAIRGSLFLTGGQVRHGGVTVEQQVGDNLPRLRADERKLKQMLVNLLSNAFKFTPDGGTVTIAAGYDEDRGFDIQVRDTGIGMSVEDIPKAMVRFGQIDSSLARKFGGTGLGLPLTKALVELHGGSLDVDSAIGKGTTVTLHFPAARAVTARGAVGLLGNWRRRQAGA